MVELAPTNRQLAQRIGDVVGGTRRWHGRRLGMPTCQQPPLMRHTEYLLEILERLGELRRAEVEYVGNLLRLARLSHLFQS